MTTITINKQQHDLEATVAAAIEKAGNGYVCPPDRAAAESFVKFYSRNPDEIPAIALHITITRYIKQAMGWYQLDWQKIDSADYVGSLVELGRKFNKRAGVRALKSKYGRDAA